MANKAMKTARVWDLPTRLFHWALVGTVCTGWYLGEYRSFSTIQLHFYCGYATGALLAFRLLWGLVGPRNIRLSALFPSPRRLRDYLKHVLRRSPSGVAGHNPIGSLSVIAMLLLLLTQVGTGLFSEDDSLFSKGPLANYASEAMRLELTAVHYISSRLILAVIILHVAAILFYYIWKRENLIRPMITGWKSVKDDSSE